MNKRTVTTGAIIFSLAAAGAPAASARPVDYLPVGKQVPASSYDRADKVVIPGPRGLAAYREGQLAASLDVAGTAAKASAPQALVRVHAPQSGFDWGDAGLGAAGLALSGIGVGGAFAVFHRRSRRTNALAN
jgi:hypothetical protein